MAPRVIGIDATQSSRKPADLVLLHGEGSFVHARLREDDAIIGWVLRQEPALVGIDAPLAWPAPGGRRAAEVALFQRGIRLYWTTERSFVRPLIERWISLAHRLREAGIPVVEVYPWGAKWELWGRRLPSKTSRAGRALLAGLMDADGLLPAGWDHRAGHDALDALLAAWVTRWSAEGTALTVGNPFDGEIVLPRRRWGQGGGP